MARAGYFGISVFVFASAMPPVGAAALSISGIVNGSRLVIGTSARTSGAIDSLVWRGREFLNSYDHGRELQSAASFDGYGECLNPTEAGSAADGTGPATSSRLVSSRAGGRKLETVVEMAYWLKPGAEYPLGCGSHPDFRAAKNQTVRSRDLLIRRVQIGVPGAPDALAFDVTFRTFEDHASATFEALTGYMPPEFSEFLRWNPRTGSAEPLDDGPGEQPLPVILATPDRAFAMGVYSPHAAVGYGRFRFTENPRISGWNTVKWNAVFREKPVPAGSYRYRCYVAVGTLDDVRRVLKQVSLL